MLISVDGERDTPARLKSFLAPLSPEFVGLTGDPKATATIAAQFAAVFFKEPAGKDGNYNVMHSTQVFAVDKAGPPARFVCGRIHRGHGDDHCPAARGTGLGAAKASTTAPPPPLRNAAWNAA